MTILFGILFVLFAAAAVIFIRSHVKPAIKDSIASVKCALYADEIGIPVGSCNIKEVAQSANREIDRRADEQARKAMKRLKEIKPAKEK